MSVKHEYHKHVSQTRVSQTCQSNMSITNMSVKHEYHKHVSQNEYHKHVSQAWVSQTCQSNMSITNMSIKHEYHKHVSQTWVSQTCQSNAILALIVHSCLVANKKDITNAGFMLEKQKIPKQTWLKTDQAVLSVMCH